MYTYLSKVLQNNITEAKFVSKATLGTNFFFEKSSFAFLEFDAVPQPHHLRPGCTSHHSLKGLSGAQSCGNGCQAQGEGRGFGHNSQSSTSFGCANTICSRDFVTAFKGKENKNRLKLICKLPKVPFVYYVVLEWVGGYIK